MDSEEIKSNLTSSKHWLRLLFMVLFAVILYIAAIVMSVLVALQFLFSLISGRDNRNLRHFGQSLAQYIYRTLRFLTYNSEDKPFPFDDWPAVQEPPPPAPKPRTPRAKATAKKTAAKKTTAKTGTPPPDATDKPES